MKDYFGIIKFGQYPQGENGEIERIEWLVLDKQDGYMLLLSKNILDFIPTNKKKDKVTWETCTLRKWLNEEFINIAFSDSEKARILKATLEPDTSMSGMLVVCNETEDKIALMSKNECYTYFTSNESRMCKSTRYADSQRAKKCKANMQIPNLCDSWVIRIDGPYSREANFVFSYGEVCEFGNPVNTAGGIRPAMFIASDVSDDIYDEHDCFVSCENGLHIKNNVLTRYEGTNAEVIIPEGVHVIGEKAFQGNKTVEQIVLPDSIINIGNNTFDGCTKLVQINIPKSIKTVGVYAFSCCYALTEITIPEGVEKLETKSFFFCKALRKIVLPNSLTDISEDAFLSCGELTIYAPEGSYAEHYAKNKNIPFISTGTGLRGKCVNDKSDIRSACVGSNIDTHVALQVTSDDILNLWDYVISSCNEDDINHMIKEFCFDLARLNKLNLSGLSADGLWVLFADVVYMVLNGVGNGDFQTMYSILSEILGIDSDVIDSVLNY